MLWKVVLHALIPAAGTRSFPVSSSKAGTKAEGAGLEENTSTSSLRQGHFSPELWKGFYNQGLQLTPNKRLPLWCKVQAIIKKLCLPV